MAYQEVISNCNRCYLLAQSPTVSDSELYRTRNNALHSLDLENLPRRDFDRALHDCIICFRNRCPSPKLVEIFSK